MNIRYGAGGVIGRKHRLDGLNYQDSHQISISKNRFVAVVTDGLSLVINEKNEEENTKCEFGAIIGAHLITKTVGELSLRVDSAREKEVFSARPFWTRVEEDVLAHLRTSALHFGGNLSDVISHFFLFTSLGVLMTPNYTVFYGIGDGNFFVNGERIKIGPFAKNEPPYLAHRLLPYTHHKPEDMRFSVHAILPTPEVKHFLVGTDGVNDIVDSEEKLMPARQNKVGPISQFWTAESFVTQPAAVELRLNMFADDRETVDWNARKINKHPGLLPDDTTFVVGRTD